MNVSSWPMFLLRTLTGSELAPAVLFKKVRKALQEISVLYHMILFSNGNV